NPSHMAPWLRSDFPDYQQFVAEEAEQIYRFPFFTPEFCQLLIAEAEHCGHWETESFTSVNILGALETNDPESILHFHRMPRLEEIFHDMMERHLCPLIKRLWQSFAMQQKDRPCILRYEPTVINQIGLHDDSETIALPGVLLLITLSAPEDYEGGGTYFPRW